jgi:hypothetical protein
LAVVGRDFDARRRIRRIGHLSPLGLLMPVQEMDVELGQESAALCRSLRKPRALLFFKANGRAPREKMLSLFKKMPEV